MWIIDDSGPTAEVAKRVEALAYDSFVEVARKKLAQLESRQLAAADYERRRFDVEIAGCRDVLASMDVDDRSAFERARTFVLAELGACRTNNAGVCARLMPNPTESPRGRALSVVVAEYDVR